MKGIFIFVCDRGFVTVGDAEISDRLAFHWHLKASVTIRKWGTTNGLAELKNGPTENTKMDEVCERTVPFRSIIDIIHVTEKGHKKWTKALYEK